MSARRPSSCSSSSPSENSMRRKRVSHATSAANASKRSSAAGSRSMQTRVPVGPIRSATRRAWPPSPKVQSTAVSPGAGSRSSISSPARTGTCARVMSRRMAKALSDPDDLVRELVLIGLPGLSVPHLEVVEVADQDDFLLDPRVPDQRRVQRHAAGRVELDVERAAREEARQLAALGADRVQVRQERVRPGVELLGHPHRDAGLEPLRENDAGAEVRTELGRHGEPVLRVERVVEVPAERQMFLRDPCPWGGVERSWLPTEVAEWEEPIHPGLQSQSEFYPTCPHFATHFSTRPIQPPTSSRSPTRRSALGAGLRAVGSGGDAVPFG